VLVGAIGGMIAGMMMAAVEMFYGWISDMHIFGTVCVLQDADGNEETELITIELAGDGAPPVIELTTGVRITCTQP
jgi:hypothetical protein